MFLEFHQNIKKIPEGSCDTEKQHSKNANILYTTGIVSRHRMLLHSTPTLDLALASFETIAEQK